MSNGKRWGTVLAMLGFMGLVIWLSIPKTAHSCEVCLEFKGERVCRTGVGNSQAEARKAAQESTCGGNVRGMSESIACANADPVKLTCTAP
jgi:hypothetical protein